MCTTWEACRANRIDIGKRHIHALSHFLEENARAGSALPVHFEILAPPLRIDVDDFVVLSSDIDHRNPAWKEMMSGPGMAGDLGSGRMRKSPHCAARIRSQKRPRGPGYSRPHEESAASIDSRAQVSKLTPVLRTSDARSPRSGVHQHCFGRRGSDINPAENLTSLTGLFSPPIARYKLRC